MRPQPVALDSHPPKNDVVYNCHYIIGDYLMQEKNEIAIFENKKIRRIWHEEDWWFSVVDVVGALTDSSEPKRYWSDLKIKMRDESGIEPYDKIVQLKLIAEDGKLRETDCANLEGIFRITQ